MKDTFQISDPVKLTTDDALMFTITDNGRHIPASISRTALTLLASSGADVDWNIFMANKEKIRAAASAMRERNMGLDFIALGSNNF